MGQLDYAVILTQPFAIGLDQRGPGAHDAIANHFPGQLFHLRGSHPAARKREKAVPIGFEWKFELDTDDAVIEILEPCLKLAGGKGDRLPEFDYGRRLEAHIFGSGIAEARLTRGGLDAESFAQALQIDLF